jgi:hypothetical protein
MKTRLALLASLVFSLAACLQVSERDAPAAVTVTRAEVVIAGPAGFCVDPRVSSARSDSAFVVLGSCAAISNTPLAPQPDLPVALTATVAPTGTAAFSPEEWEAYFRSDTGKARLSTRGRSDEIEILATRTKGQSFYLYAHDKGSNREHWRGIVNLRDAVITLSMRPVGKERLSARARFALLDAFGNKLLAVNRSIRLSTKQTF